MKHDDMFPFMLDRCGWNPHVDAIRKEEIRRKLADAPPPPVYEKPTMIIKWR